MQDSNIFSTIPPPPQKQQKQQQQQQPCNAHKIAADPICDHVDHNPKDIVEEFKEKLVISMEGGVRKVKEGGEEKQEDKEEERFEWNMMADEDFTSVALDKEKELALASSLFSPEFPFKMISCQPDSDETLFDTHFQGSSQERLIYCKPGEIPNSLATELSAYKRYTGYCVNCGIKIPYGSHCYACHCTPDYSPFVRGPHPYAVELSVSQKFLNKHARTPLERYIFTCERREIMWMGHEQLMKLASELCVRVMTTTAKLTKDEARIAYRTMNYYKLLLPQDIDVSDHAFGDIIDLVLGWIKSAGEAIHSFNSEICKRFSELLESVVEWFTSAVEKVTYKSLVNYISSFLPGESDPSYHIIKFLVLALKTFIRVHQETPHHMIVVELLWDSWVLSYFKDAFFCLADKAHGKEPTVEPMTKDQWYEAQFVARMNRKRMQIQDVLLEQDPHISIELLLELTEKEVANYARIIEASLSDEMYFQYRTDFKPPPEDHSSSGDYILVILGCFLGKLFGIDLRDISSFGNIMRNSDYIIPNDISAFFTTVPFIDQLFKGEPDSVMRLRLPATMYYLDKVSEYRMKLATSKSGKPEDVFHDELRYKCEVNTAYAAYLREKKNRWKDSDAAYFASRYRDLELPPSCAKVSLSENVQAPMIWFSGWYGAGKTKATQQLAELIRITGIKRKWPGMAGIESSQWAYSVPDTDFWQGYLGQTCIIFNDAFSAKEVAGQAGTSFKIRSLVDDMAFAPPMADLEDKGIFVRARVVLASSNFTLDQAMGLCKSMNNPGALKRRARRLEFEVIPKKYNEYGEAMFSENEGINQWRFLRKENGKTLEYEFMDVANLIVNAIEKCAQPNPIDDLPAQAVDDLLKNLDKPVQGREFVPGDYHQKKALWTSEASRSGEDKAEKSAPIDPNKLRSGKKVKEAKSWKRTKLEQPDDHMLDGDMSIWFPAGDLRHEDEKQEPKDRSEAEVEEEDVPGEKPVLETVGDRELFLADRTGQDYESDILGPFYRPNGLPLDEDEAAKVRKIKQEDLKDPAFRQRLAEYVKVKNFTAAPPKPKTATWVDASTDMLTRMIMAVTPFVDMRKVTDESFVVEADHARMTKDHLQLNGYRAYGPMQWRKDKYNKKELEELFPASGAKWKNLAFAAFIAGFCVFTYRMMKNAGEALAEKVMSKGLEEKNKTFPPKAKKDSKSPVTYVQSSKGVWQTVKNHSEPEFTNKLQIQETKLLEQKIFHFKSTEKGPTICFCLVLNSSEIIVPSHAITGKQMFCIEQREFGQVQKFCNVPGVPRQFMVAYDHYSDLALVRMLNHHIEYGSGDQGKKFCDGFTHGFVSRIGLEEPMVASCGGLDAIRHGNSRLKTVHPIEMPSRQGFCGMIYYNADSKSSSRIVGMHVSGSDSMSYMAPLDKAWYEGMKDKLNIASKPLTGPDMVPVSKNGILMEGKSCLKVVLPRQSAFAPLDPIIKGFSKTAYPLKHGLARLINPIGEVQPYTKGCLKMVDGSKKKGDGNFCAEWKSIEEIATMFLNKYGHCAAMDFVETWNDCVKKLNEHSAVDQSKSAGIGQGLKSEFFVGSDLKPEFIAECEQEVKLLADGYCPMGVTAVTLKDEKLLMEKVQDSKTRAFCIVGMKEIILGRRYLEPIYRFLRRYGKELGIMYACTPEEIGTCFAEHKGKKVICADVKNQQAGHGISMWLEIFYFMLLIRVFDNETDGPKYNMHPDFPPLNEVNCIRYNLFRKGMVSYLLMHTYLKILNGLLRSGHFGTTGMNCLKQWLLMQLLILEIFMLIERGILNWKFDPEDLRALLFGDDLTAFIRLEEKYPGLGALMQEHWKKYGYELVDANNKDQAPVVTDFEDASLCGRSYRHDPEIGHTAVLEPSRINKALCFYKKNDLASYAATLNNALVELCRHEEEVFDEFMEALVWENGIALVHYIDSYQMCRTRWFAGKLGAQEDLCRSWIVASSGSIVSPAFIKDHAEQVEEEEAPFDKGKEEVQADDSLTVFRHNNTFDTCKVAPMNTHFKTCAPVDRPCPILEREVLVDQFTVTSANTQNDIVYKQKFPSAYFDAAFKAQAELFDTAAIHFKAIKLRFIVMGTGFQKCAFLFGGSPMARTPIDVYQFSSGPHVLVSVSTADDAEFSIPFTRDLLIPTSADYGESTQDTYFNFVEVIGMVLVQLDSPTQNNVEVAVYASMVDPVYLESGITTHAIAPFNFASDHGERESVIPGQVPDDPTVATPIGQVQPSVTNYPFANWNLSTGDILLASKPTAPVTVTQVRPAQGAGIANVFGVDLGLLLGAGPESKEVPVVDLLHGRQLADFNEMGGKMSIFYIYNWLNTLAPNTTMISLTCSPYVGQHTNCGWVASAFAYWRCTMIYKFVFIKPAATAGSVRITVDYGRKFRVVADTNQYASLYRVIVDIKKGDGSITVRIPYIHNTPFREAFISGPGIPGPEGPTLELSSVTGLTTNDNVSDSVDIIMYAGFEDAHFLWPTYTTTPIPEAQVSVQDSKGKERIIDPIGDQAESGRVQSSADMYVPSNMQMTQAPEVWLGPTHSRFEEMDYTQYMSMYGAGEVITSFQHLFKRKILTRTIGTAGGYEINTALDFNDPTHFPDPLNHFMSMFVFAYGGFRVTIMPQATGAIAWADFDLSGGPLSDHFNTLKPFCVIADSDAPIQDIQVNNPSIYPIYVWDNPNRCNAVIKTQAPGINNVFVSVSDSFLAMGKNYNLANHFISIGDRARPKTMD